MENVWDEMTNKVETVSVLAGTVPTTYHHHHQSIHMWRVIKLH